MDMEKIVSLCKRKGFIFQASEIYGGINGFWDYGPLGVELKKNIKDAWWNDMVRNPPPGPDGEEIVMVGLDSAIIQNPKVWVASGHASGFADPMVDCLKCRKRYRADKLWIVDLIDFAIEAPKKKELYDRLGIKDSISSLEEALAQREIFDTVLPYLQNPYSPTLVMTVEAESKKEAQDLIVLSNTQRKAFKSEPLRIARKLTEVNEGQKKCPDRACGGDLTPPRSFNLMFESHAGAIQDEANKVWLRPETAQGIFTNFKNVVDSCRVKPPFGIAQVGKAFRNEVNPRNYTFRSREFEQMEIEFFCPPDSSMKWYEYWRDVRKAWYTKLGIKSEKLRPREQGDKELAHYSKACTDIEYLFPFSEEPQELEGVAHRGAFDLTQHQQHSGKDLSYFDEAAWAMYDKSAFKGDKKREQEEKAKFRYIPHVIEPSAGADRFTLAVLCEAYSEDTMDGEIRTVMRFHPRLAPVKAAILPLVNKEGMPEIAEKLYRELKRDWNVQYDDGGAIGRRYRRQDEIGTPFCFTIDGQTLQDQSVTIRYRDDGKQERLPMTEAANKLREALRP
ncbi:MAG: glycine--tRNA ligase [Planctomycetia bacterium]|nr:glycine--tRNA ligase [Planctomycetia bacterium]